jgi:uncharacterized protein
MRKSETALRLRIFLNEADKYKGRPLYEEIVVQAQRARLAGATVFRGYLGYSTTSALDTKKILGRSEEVPMVVEILDSERKINGFLDALDQLLTSGVATVELVQLHRYRPKTRGQPGLSHGKPGSVDQNSSATCA